MHPPARTAKDYILPFFIIIALSLIAMLSFRLWGLLIGAEDESGQFALTGQANLNVVQAGVDVYLPASESWKTVSDSGTSLSSGESIRTTKNGSAQLEFDDGTKIILSASTELTITELKNTLTKRSVALTLNKGTVWLKSGDPSRSALTITTDLLKTNKIASQVLLTKKGTSTELTAVSGGANAIILDPQDEKNPELKTLAIEEGETLNITDKRVNLLRIGGTLDLVKPTSDEIKTSAFYLANAMTSTTTDGERPVSSDDVAETNETATAETSDTADQTLATPVVTSPSGGQLTTSKDTIEISGTASAVVANIEVVANGKAPYALSKFVSGAGNWLYRAGTKFENLQDGENTYQIYAVTADGRRSEPATVKITYEPITKSAETAEETATTTTTTTAATDGVPDVGVATFGAPTVSTPTDGETYKIAPIRFAGTVPTGTASVEINGYTLSKFTAGTTSWYYNATLEYNNLTVGENEYEIEAISGSGERSSVKIKIIYAPEE